ncbi:uncharacterized protein LOC128167316 [Crassostrea angulata]|uniref:uncharacterized protein LOC128167316 n=1 Tax=Magallana angulata TaxID=2784310 RepID=UPI0022B1B9EE|nr:uncharacterized protein LOC128167316 [Crassostrea angulata]
MSAADRRIRKLTPKGLVMFNEQCEKLKSKTDETWAEVEDALVTSGTCAKDFHKIREVERLISVKFKDFCIASEDYKKYLLSQNTEDAVNLLNELEVSMNKCFSIVKRTSDELKETKFELLETLSHVSSNVSSFQRAKAQAERAKLELIKKEGELLKQKTDIEAKISIVRQEKEIISAEADFTEEEKIDLPIYSREQMTSAFILKHDHNPSNTEDGHIQQNQPYFEQNPPISVQHPEADGRHPGYLNAVNQGCVPSIPIHQMHQLCAPSNSVNPVCSTSISVPQVCASQNSVSQVNVPLNSVSQVSVPSNSVPQMRVPNSVDQRSAPLDAASRVFVPSNSMRQVCVTTNSLPHVITAPNLVPPRTDNTSTMADFSKFLLRKDFLLTRFTNFDDRPENFNSWSSSFRSVILELGVTEFEEMDLLVKWLGPESSKFARTLRSANTHNPSLGVKRIWDRLNDKYGRPEMVEHALKQKLHSFPTLKNKDHAKLYDLVDILTEIESAMTNPKYEICLSYFNSSTGVLPIVAKLPISLQDKWTSQAAGYKKRNDVAFPPFSFFVEFIREMCEIRNDPGLVCQPSTNTNMAYSKPRPTGAVISRKVEIVSSTPSTRCPIHNAGHSLNECRGFKRKSLRERQNILRDKKLCFRCCASPSHVSKNCTADIKCDICGNPYHVTAMHIDRRPSNPESPTPVSTAKTALSNGGEYEEGKHGSRSCGKIVLVDVFCQSNPAKVIRVYATIDDQSNRTLVSPYLIDRLGVTGECKPYTLTSCSGVTTVAGRRVNGLCVKALDGTTTFNLPEVIECDSIPSEHLEIPTPKVAQSQPHLQCIAPFIPPLDRNVNVELLIGRDLTDVHHVREQITGSQGQPFAQRLPLGWVVIGEICIDKVHPPKEVNVNKTHSLNDGRCTTFPVCHNNINVKDNDDDIFIRTPFDNKIGPSVEDRKFVALMDAEFHKDTDGFWSAPLPFKESKPVLPNNYSQAWKRALILNTSLKKDHHKRQHFFAFMSKVLASGAAEVAPSDIPGECWYLPLFGVYNSKKPDQIRGVFDSSAVFQDVSLNSVLMSGPDLTNNLVGILMRFRENAIAISGDIQQMFYAFRVHEDHRDYLRFFWYEDNNFEKPLIQYRMKAHVFGNTPSPAVATYGLRKASSVGDDDVRKFVYNNFYVDDGLTSLATESEAINLMRKTQATLKNNGNIRLHKIASNSVNVMKSFPIDDLGSDLKELNHCADICNLPVQHSLGMHWDLNCDMFVFKISNAEKPYTRRGLLSTMNSIFDPMGFISPVTISGKILHRELVSPGCHWDEPLTEEHLRRWRIWIDSLQSVNNFRVPRMIVATSISLAH